MCILTPSSLIVVETIIPRRIAVPTVHESKKLLWLLSKNPFRDQFYKAREGRSTRLRAYDGRAYPPDASLEDQDPDDPTSSTYPFNMRGYCAWAVAYPFRVKKILED